MLLALGLAALTAMGWMSLVIVIWSVSPAPATVVSDTQPYIEVEYVGFPVGARVLVDGRPAPAGLRRGESKLVALPHPLDEGAHTISVELRTWVGKSAHRMWQIRVDRQPPSLEVEAPGEGALTAERDLRVVGRTDGARVRVGEQEVVPDGSGRYEVTAELAEGPNSLEVVAFDEAGNAARVVREVVFDPDPPELEILAPAPDQRLEKSSFTFRARVQDELETELSLKIDGKWDVEVKQDEKGCSAQLDDLPEGTRLLEFTARDQAGNVSTRTVSFLVDSTETFGDGLVTLGAVGKDVTELQERLSALDFLPAEAVTGRFDEATLEAVRRCQEEHGLQPDGIVGPNLVAVLGPRIFVNLARFSLVVEDPLGPTRRYSIAHGLPEHPTPTGTFRVVEKVKDPTWIPPDSPWAREAKATPPGPDNPLGTRWLGLDSNLVGIHGTPFSWSIGTRASHGCIRMHMKEVEALFEQVGNGTPVTIFSGSEDDPDLDRLWP